MTPELLLTLGALALVDSLSIGTLLIPLFFLVAPGRVRAARLLLYLATIALFYFAVGVLLTTGASALFGDLGSALETPAAYVVQLVLGAGLLIASFFIGRKKGEDAGPGRLSRWRERALGERGGATLVLLALGAGLLEVATMLPYLGAVGLITAAELPALTVGAVLALYCLLMITPALVLLIARVVARPLVEPALQRLANWMQRSSGETTAWIVGIVGFLLARDAANALGLFEAIDALNPR